MSTIIRVLKDYSEEQLLPQNLFNQILEGTGYIPEMDDERFYTAIYPHFENYDQRHDNCTTLPIYLNDHDFRIEEDRERIVQALRTEYEGNTFDTVAVCSPSCGKYRGNMYLNSGIVCDVCGETPSRPLSEQIETKVWLRTPPRVSGFLSPAIYEVFLSKLKTKTPKINFVQYWMDEGYRRDKRFRDPVGETPAYKMAQKLNAFSSAIGIDFGYNNFIDNIDTIINAAVTQDFMGILDLNEVQRDHCTRFWAKYKGFAVSNFLPLPNKIATVIESDQRDRYVNKEKTDLEKIFFTIADMYHEMDHRSVQNEVLFGKNYFEMQAVMLKVMKEILFKKKGMFRYHAGAGKLPFTGRSIITGESGVCRSDTVVVPWLYGITCLNHHLTNWLYRRGYTPKAVKRIIRESANFRHPVIEEFFDWVENNRYAVATVGRNPSIQFLSSRTFFIKFNRDIEDKSIRIPITCVKEFGADFDGDQMYVWFIPDLFGKVAGYANFGHQQMLDPNKPFRTSRFATRAKNVLLNLNSQLLDEPIAED
ncbi:putative RNA polymerase beta prime subunit [Aeromonas phage LAh10]|nr:putative RNA polymerase beta prime subunit [Aeromonas phage LAh10]QDH47039.1 putative RNA polymerase beta prime subunit [Aeromonas phage LAh10]